MAVESYNIIIAEGLIEPNTRMVKDLKEKNIKKHKAKQSKHTATSPVYGGTSAMYSLSRDAPNLSHDML